MRPPVPQMIANGHCRTGENPLWDDRRQCLFYTDIPSGVLYRYDPVTGDHETIYRGQQVGGFTLQEDGRLLLFRVDDVALFDPETVEERSILRFTDTHMSRFNDVMADPRGRVFAGTIGKSPHCGLYRVDLDGTIVCLFKCTGCANGMAFSPDHKEFYWTDSTNRQIFAFDYDVKSGSLANRRLLVELSKEEGIPDGMTIDSRGHLWSARWDGHAIAEYDPEGTLKSLIPFPVAKVSSVIFGGPNLDTFYVTTAGGKPDIDGEDVLDGALYKVEGISGRGMGEYRSRIAGE